MKNVEQIRLFVMDVDGTLTDGKINMGTVGEIAKSFNIKDGYGVSEILTRHSIKTAIITGRNSTIVTNRAKEMQIDYICQGARNKVEVLKKIMIQTQFTFEEIAYIGDDLIDYECMKLCRLSGCPSDAVKEVKKIANFISSYKGGEGAVREFIEWIVSSVPT